MNIGDDDDEILFSDRKMKHREIKRESMALDNGYPFHKYI
jgi:hypothetical protein